MTQYSIKVDFDVFTVEDLPEPWQVLLNKAKGAAEEAYADYSNFLVGAALELASGRFIIGNNQENAAYPSGLCAERVAFFSASSQFPDDPIIRACVVGKKAESDDYLSAAPCGACRQVMLEYEIKQESEIPLLIFHENNQVLISRNVSDLLPVSFSRKNLL